MRDIRTVAVVGAGTMGSAITQHFLMKGLRVRLLDNNVDGLARGQRLIAFNGIHASAGRQVIAAQCLHRHRQSQW